MALPLSSASTDRRDDVVRMLTAVPDGLSDADLAQRLGGADAGVRPGTVNALCRRMVSEGLVERVGTRPIRNRMAAGTVATNGAGAAPRDGAAPAIDTPAIDTPAGTDRSSASDEASPSVTQSGAEAAPTTSTPTTRTPATTAAPSAPRKPTPTKTTPAKPAEAPSAPAEAATVGKRTAATTTASTAANDDAANGKAANGKAANGKAASTKAASAKAAKTTAATSAKTTSAASTRTTKSPEAKAGRRSGGGTRTYGRRTEPAPTVVKDVAQAWSRTVNVQAAVASWLTGRGATIRTVTEAGQGPAGDLVVSMDGHDVHVEVTGWPPDGARTHPTTIAGDWFTAAEHAAVARRRAHPDARIVIALPDTRRYRALQRHRADALDGAGTEVWFVDPSGSVDAAGEHGRGNG